MLMPSSSRSRSCFAEAGNLCPDDLDVEVVNVFKQRFKTKDEEGPLLSEDALVCLLRPDCENAFQV